MFGYASIFKSRNKSPEVTQLNLGRGPNLPPVPAPPQPHLPSLDQINTVSPEAHAEVNNLVRQLLEAGVNTTHLSYIGDPERGATFTLRGNDVSKCIIVLFSSPLLALDYIRTHRVQGRAIQVKIEDLPTLAEQWPAAGIDSFVFNPCPRCKVLNILTPSTSVITIDQVRLAWVTWRVIRQRNGEFCLQSFLKNKPELADKRVTLEFVRDHVDYANPYIHWLIAIYAGIQCDEPARLAATALLEEFGPAFKDRTRPISDSSGIEAWGALATKATLGYANSYKTLAANPALPSNSSVIGIPDPPR